jgi:4-hydroxybenzoate polyprenyltransferase
VAPWWLVTAGAALGAAAHLANVAPDLEDDLATGVRGLPHRLGARASAVAGALLLGGASLALVLGPDGPPSAAGWAALVLAVPAVVAAALAGTPRFRRLAFPAVMLLTVLDVALLIAGGAALV